MDDQHNPTAYEDLGPTLPSTYSAKPQQTSQPSATIRRLIGELGLRYRPSAQADLEAHAASISLLARDLADLPPKYLDKAIRQWVIESPYMPKACELVALARDFLIDDQPRTVMPDARPWEPADTFNEADRCTPEQAAEIMAEFGLRRNPLDVAKDPA